MPRTKGGAWYRGEEPRQVERKELNEYGDRKGRGGEGE